METPKDEMAGTGSAGAGTEEEPRKPRRAPHDDKGMERPRFLLDFPEDPDLERLIVAFEAGNFALVRKDAEKVAAATESPAVREAALELRRRIDPDPLAKYLLAISLVLLLVVAIWAYRAGSH
jgi:hypothetical protein